MRFRSERRDCRGKEDFEVTEKFEQDAYDREFCIIVAMVLASLEALAACGENHCILIPEMKIAEGLAEQLEELAESVSVPGQNERWTEMAGAAMEAFVVAATEAPHGLAADK
jgi:hypothetical protein